nr:MAG TPA: hypothetical protein [Caudoviricetes sp.]
MSSLIGKIKVPKMVYIHNPFLTPLKIETR